MNDEAILVVCAGECGKFARVGPDADACPNCGACLRAPSDEERQGFEDAEKREQIRSLSTQLRAAKPKADLFDRLQAPDVQQMSVAGAMQHVFGKRFESLALNIAALDPMTDDPRTVLALCVTLARRAIQGLDAKDGDK